MIGALSSADQGGAHDTLIGLVWLLGVAGLIFAICGSVLGYKRKIVVYDSKADLNVTCVSIFSWVCSGFAFGFRSESPLAVWMAWPLLLLSVILTINSMKRSAKANRAAWETILSVFAKYALLVLIALCVLIAVGGAFGAVDEAKKKRYKEAAVNAAAGAVGAVGFLAVQRLIDQLITEAHSIKRTNQ